MESTSEKGAAFPAQALVRACRDSLKKLMQHGAASLSEAELLEVLFAPRPSQPLDRFETTLASQAGGLKALLTRNPHELGQLPGLGLVRAGQLLSAMELGRRIQRTSEKRPRLKSPSDIYQYLHPQLTGLRREVFHVLCLNTRSTLLADVRVAEGTVDSCPVDPREVFAAPLSYCASGIILVHNHPSGDPEPSSADLALTAQLVEGGRVLGIRVLDHLILGENRWVSLLQQGRMPFASGAPRTASWNS